MDMKGYQMVTEDPLLNWLGVKSMNCSKYKDIDEADHKRLENLIRTAERNIHYLSKSERRILATSWFKQWCENESASLFKVVKSAEGLRGNIHAVHEEIDRRALVQAHVVGITTTSLTRNIETLRRIGAKVIICEEVAEVIEAYIISSLIPGLRLQIQNYSLSLKSSSRKAWQLDRSQFERRAVGEPGLNPIPVAQLNTIDVIKTREKTTFEVDIATALIRHLIRQGEYKSNNIALLTPYTSQLQKLRASLSKDFEIYLSERDLETLAAEGLGVDIDNPHQAGIPKVIERKTLLQTLRLTTVDNFQGEEAKVIVVSLVRSNLNDKLAFYALRTASMCSLADVHAQLILTNAVGTELALYCPRHPERKSPKGGYNLPYTRRLEPYSYQCQAKYHSSFIHHGFACCKPYPRIRQTYDHACPKLCGTECGLCMVKIPDVMLPYGHMKKTLICHQIRDLESIKCDFKVDKIVSECGHVLRLACFIDVTSGNFCCTKPCTDILRYGHNCGGLCGMCSEKGEDGVVSFNHTRYTKKCDRPHGVCSHRYAMMVKVVGIMKRNARFDAPTQPVPPPAERHVHHVSKNALGFVPIKAPAQCLAQHRVTDFRVMSDAPEFSTVVISVQAFAEKTVQVVCVKNAVTSQMLVSISLNGNLILKLTWTRAQLSSSDAVTSLRVSRSTV
ncbi:hypothetical protein N7516_008639 [Penicillium verrucosum]|uniref:uncharacterized protein n=1 Tax=Penicillium verrucosum TaxID=60171 RepID=UPI002545943E|nr:uncharacterized protein N7516_008639 [Penicillium verrucosum]KAJ5926866.1 hypothetical protein N7516_008639 [Penicillium verrucosum]